MPHEKPAQETEETGNQALQPAAYEPPQLVRVGSLRDLVGKSGARFDIGGPKHKRP